MVKRRKHKNICSCKFPIHTSIVAFSCMLLYKNKNCLGTFEARGRANFKNIELRPKCTGSYKEEYISSVHWYSNHEV